MPPARPQRFYYLDSARGLAALSVSTWHFIAAFYNVDAPVAPVTSPFHFFWYAQGDIVFFFIYSGFILSYSYIGVNKPLTVISYVKFLIERIFRIYPIFLFILFISFFLHNSIFPVTDGKFTVPALQQFWARPYNLADVLKEGILFIPVVAEGNLRLIPQDWTLTIELIVGSMVPFVAFLARRNKRIFWPVIFIAIVVLRMSTYLFEFSAGVFLFYEWEYISKLWQKMNLVLKWLIAIVAIVFYCCFFRFPSLFSTVSVMFRPGVDRFIVAMGCFLFFCILVSSRFVQKNLSAPWLVKIGRLCYSIYIVHMVLLICFADYFMKLIHQSMSISYFGELALTFVAFMIATLMLSFVTYWLIEQPFNKLGKRISRAVGKSFSGVKS